MPYRRRRERRHCHDGPHRDVEGAEHRQARSGDHSTAQARQALQDRQMTVFVYVNTSKQVGDADHIKVFGNDDAAEKWFEEKRPGRGSIQI
jgi:hypothetical protein